MVVMQYHLHRLLNFYELFLYKYLDMVQLLFLELKNMIRYIREPSGFS